MTIIRESLRTLDTTKPKPRNATQNKTRKEARFARGNRSGLEGFLACAVASYVIDCSKVYPRNNVRGIRWLRHDDMSYMNDHSAQVAPVFVIMLYFFSCRNSGDAADLHRSACVHTYDTTHVNMCGSYYLRVEGWLYPSSPVGGHPKIIHGIPNVGTL